MVATASTSISADDFLRLPASEGAELVDGRIVDVPMGGESSWLGGELFRLVSNHAGANQLGVAFPQETGIAVWTERPNNVRKPDVMFIRKGRLDGSMPKGWVRTVPDLVAEVVSPGDEAEDLERKLLDYREAGIPLIWVIFPNTRTAQVLTLDARLDVGPDGVLDGGDILPGFTCALRDLFAAAEAEL